MFYGGSAGQFTLSVLPSVETPSRCSRSCSSGREPGDCVYFLPACTTRPIMFLVARFMFLCCLSRSRALARNVCVTRVCNSCARDPMESSGLYAARSGCVLTLCVLCSTPSPVAEVVGTVVSTATVEAAGVQHVRTGVMTAAVPAAATAVQGARQLVIYKFCPRHNRRSAVHFP